MVFGRDIRLGRILDNGKMLCIPMDHGISTGPIFGIEDIISSTYKCEGSGLTSILVNPGIIKAMPRPPLFGIIVHLSASTSLSSSPNKKVLLGSVEEAIRLGADAVSLHINIGSKEEPEMLYDMGLVSDKCIEWNIPLLAMMYPRGENIKNAFDPEIIAHAARIGAEAGADIVKTVYTGDMSTFKKVVRCCPVPVVIAGGPKARTDEEVLKMCHEAVSCGAIGVTFGRNIFQHASPISIIKALYDIIIRGKNVNDAMKRFGKEI